MGIAEAVARQLAQSVGIEEVGTMDSKALSLPEGNNSVIVYNQVRSDIDDSVNHPPALLTMVNDLDEEVDLTFRGLNFRAEDQAQTYLSAPITSDPSVEKPEETGSSSIEVNSSPQVKENIGDLAEVFSGISIEYSKQHEADQLLDNSMEFDSIDLSNQYEQDFANLNGSVSYLSQNGDNSLPEDNMEFEDFTSQYDGVSNFSQNKWQPGLQLQGHPTIAD